MITYQRPLKASDRHDQAIVTDKEQAVIWAVGAINSQGTVSYHNALRNSGEFTRYNTKINQISRSWGKKKKKKKKN
jgi:hypothetical protein